MYLKYFFTPQITGLGAVHGLVFNEDQGKEVSTCIRVKMER